MILPSCCALRFSFRLAGGNKQAPSRPLSDRTRTTILAPSRHVALPVMVALFRQKRPGQDDHKRKNVPAGLTKNWVVLWDYYREECRFRAVARRERGYFRVLQVHPLESFVFTLSPIIWRLASEREATHPLLHATYIDRGNGATHPLEAVTMLMYIYSYHDRIGDPQRAACGRWAGCGCVC